MMNTLIFKLGTMVFLGSSTVAAFVYSGLCPTGQSCANKAKVVTASTMDQTAEPAAMNGHCAKQKAAMASAEECQKAKKVAMASAEDCQKSKKVAKSGCKYSKANTEVAQNTELPAEASQN